MLMAGLCPVLIRWDHEDERLAFEAIEPSHLIVPQWTKELEKADRVAIVRINSRESSTSGIRGSRIWTLAFIDQIMGRGATLDGTNEWLEQLKLVREGQSYFEFKDQIVYWEIWRSAAPTMERNQKIRKRMPKQWKEPGAAEAPTEEPATEDKGKPYWKILLASPYPDEELRQSHRNPFKHGKLPIVRFVVEVKDNDHYSSRGIPERIGAFETSATKQWNEKNDFMTLVLSATVLVGFADPEHWEYQIHPRPGMSARRSRVSDMGPIPDAFEEEMNYQRSVAEELCGVPDFGQGAQDNVHDARTATEVSNIAQVMNVGVDLKARTFRSSLGQVYNLAWATLLQYDEKRVLHGRSNHGDARFRGDGSAQGRSLALEGRRER